MQLTAIIEANNTGYYTIYTQEDYPIFGYGESLEEAKADYEETLQEQADFYEQHAATPAPWRGASVTYRYALSALFAAFPFLNASALARTMGINDSLMRRYKKGLAHASEKQVALIQGHLQQLAAELAAVQL